jgi:regulator of protease activity HflC (stomatin/prohibitin superfamily)
MESSNKLVYWLVGGFVGLIVVLWLMPFTVVDAGERVVVTRWGKVVRTLDPGVHWVTPIAESTETFDVRTQKEEVTASAASKDLQSVTAVIALNYNLDPENVGDIYQSLRKEYKTRVIDPAIQEAVKASTAKFTAEELITKREVVKEEMLGLLRVRLASEHIVASGVSIVDFDFSPDFNKAIELKVKAQQMALQAENDLKRIQFEAQQTIATANATAQSIRLQSDAANNEKYIQLKQLEVQLEYAKKWDGVLPTSIYAGVPLPIMNVIGGVTK